MKWKLTPLEAVEKVIELKKNSDQANLIGHTRLAPLSSGVQRWEQHNEFLTSGVWVGSFPDGFSIPFPYKYCNSKEFRT